LPSASHTLTSIPWPSSDRPPKASRLPSGDHAGLTRPMITIRFPSLVSSRAFVPSASMT
jgi:hypothetical protein